MTVTSTPDAPPKAFAAFNPAKPAPTMSTRAINVYNHCRTRSQMESNMKTFVSVLAIAVMGASFAAAQSQVKKETVEGIRNLAKIESTVACAGAITPAAVAGIKNMGYASIINLREASEQGADVE